MQFMFGIPSFVHFGEGVSQKLGETAAGMGAKKAFMVYDILLINPSPINQYDGINTVKAPDKAKTWTVSWLGRYETHAKQRGHDVRYGDDFHFEWGIGKALPASAGIGPLKGFEVGVVGYAQFQVTDDRGKDVAWDDVHDRVFAVGPEIRFAVPTWKTLVELRTNIEFGAVDCTEGIMTSLNITKAF
jgi:hypothetical protein